MHQPQRRREPLEGNFDFEGSIAPRPTQRIEEALGCEVQAITISPQGIVDSENRSSYGETSRRKVSNAILGYVG